MMEIQHGEHGKRGAFYIEEDGEWIAEMTYVRSGDNEITIDHTEIGEKLRGENIGKDLLSAVIAFARANGLNIRATCPYAARLLERDTGVEDVFLK